MSKGKSTSMTRKAASRIAAAVAKKHGGEIPPKSFATRVDAVVQRAQTNTAPDKSLKL